MIVVDNFEEIFAVKRWQARVWQRHFPKHMISEKYFMVQAMSKVGVGRGLQESSDKECQSSDFHIEKPKATVFWLPVEDKFTGLLQAVLVQPGLHLAVDGGDVLGSQVQAAAFKPHFR